MNYDIAKPSDSAEIVHLLAKVFSQSDPPAVAMALSIEDFEQFLQRIVPSVIPDGVTVVARSEDSGKLAGVLFSDDFARPADLDVRQISPKFLPILSMLDALDEQFRRRNTIEPETYLHLFMLGVDRHFAGQGIAQGLVRVCLDNGLRLGYRSAVTEATGKVSQHIFRKNPFADRFSVPYRTFLYEDRTVFASIQDHQKAILMERSLA